MTPNYSVNRTQIPLRGLCTGYLGRWASQGGWFVLTILWHNPDANGYTDHIESEWLAREGVRREVTYFITGPRSGRYEAKCDITVSGESVECNYEPYEQFNKAHGIFVGIMRLQFSDTTRQKVTQVFWKDIGKKHFEALSTTVTFAPDGPSKFDAQVEESKRLAPERRRERLTKAPRKPARMQVVSITFLRNPDVAAEVLLRARGVCEQCKQAAPFIRASDGTPYLEVHHRVRLADDGDDTVENAIALCPNCHRQAHYG